MMILVKGLGPLLFVELNETLPCLSIRSKICCRLISRLCKIDLVLLVERKGPEDVA
jgi:hypothetical protein